jgi:hypothetical protein
VLKKISYLGAFLIRIAVKIKNIKSIVYILTNEIAGVVLAMRGKNTFVDFVLFGKKCSLKAGCSIRENRIYTIL